MATMSFQPHLLQYEHRSEQQPISFIVIVQNVWLRHRTLWIWLLNVIQFC